MVKWLNYHHLLYFREIATCGGIARASEKIKVGQPALSAQLKQLEENLGSALFERKNRRLILTEAGRVALEYADEIFQKGEEFVQVFNTQNLSLKGRYRIGAADGIPKSFLCKAVERAQNAGNDCFVSLTEGSPRVLLDKLAKHELDIVFANGSDNGEDKLLGKAVGSSPVSVYGSKEYAALKENFPCSVVGKPFILPTRHSKLRQDIELAFHQLKLKYNLLAEVQDSSVKKLMAENGRGLVFLPDLAAAKLVKEGKLEKIGALGELREEYWLFAPKRAIKTPVTDVLMREFTIA